MFGPRRQQGIKSIIAKSGQDSVEVDEGYSALERVRHLGTSKLSLQRLVFVNELVDTAHEVGYDATVTHLLPLVAKLAGDAEVLVRQSLVNHLGDLAGFLIQADPEKKGYQRVVDSVLPVVAVLLNEKAPEVQQGAADAFVTLASHLRPGDRCDQVLMSVIGMSHNNDDEDARGTSVQLLNALAEALGRDLCQQFVGIGLIALCQDPSVRVRKATAASFGEIVRVVGEEYALRRLLPAFAGLCRDSHWNVRKSATENVVGFAMSLPVDQRKDLIPLMEDLLRDSQKWVKVAALQQLGYFIASLEDAGRVPGALASQYGALVAIWWPDAPDMIYHCAYTFAAVAKTMGPSKWHEFSEPFKELCRDAQPNTRKAMAASMHIVAQTLGNPTLVEQEVLPMLELLLLDSVTDVRQAALRNVASILKVASSDSAVIKIATLLQKSLSPLWTDNWRLRKHAAFEVGAICQNIGAGAGGASAVPFAAHASTGSPAGETGGEHLLSLFLALCEDGVAVVRIEAAKATAKLLGAAAPELFADPDAGEGSSGCLAGAKPPLTPPTSRLVRNLIKTFARGKSFRYRMTYIWMCDSVIREAPPHIFSDLFQWPLIRLVADPVKNVRLCWATVLAPHIRKGGRLGQNAALLCAAHRMLQAHPTDAEETRVLGSAPLAQLPVGHTAAGGPESDLDESDKGEALLAFEGGTGDSSGCSDAGIGEEEEEDRRNTQGSDNVSPTAGRQVEEVKPQSDQSLAKEGSLSPVACLLTFQPSNAANSTEPEISRSTPPFGLSPKSPEQQSLRPFTGGMVHDLVEDSLVEQGEIDRDLDNVFQDRRLLHEAELRVGARDEGGEGGCSSGYPEQQGTQDIARNIGSGLAAQTVTTADNFHLTVSGTVEPENCAPGLQR